MFIGRGESNQSKEAKKQKQSSKNGKTTSSLSSSRRSFLLFVFPAVVCLSLALFLRLAHHRPVVVRRRLLPSPPLPAALGSSRLSVAQAKKTSALVASVWPENRFFVKTREHMVCVLSPHLSFCSFVCFTLKPSLSTFLSEKEWGEREGGRRQAGPLSLSSSLPPFMSDLPPTIQASCIQFPECFYPSLT